jgi:hypothetical protein
MTVHHLDALEHTVQSKRIANELLTRHHYRGPTSRGTAYVDEFGAIVVSNPSSRRLPQGTWCEVIRWCLPAQDKNAGSAQWANFVKWFRGVRPDVTTIVSYSDPSAGHDGALYRACGWLWAPTWQRIRTPPTGQGSWDGVKRQAAKDRWVYLIEPDAARQGILRVNDESINRRMPWVSYCEPTWRRGKAVLVRQHDRYKRFIQERGRV